MDPMNIASPEGVASIASVWLGIRVVLPYLKAIPRVGGFFTGQRVWGLVFASAVGVSALAAQAAGDPSSVATVVQAAAALTIAAIGADKIIEGSGS